MWSRLGSLDLVKGIGGQHGEQLTYYLSNYRQKIQTKQNRKRTKGGEKVMYNFLVYKMHKMHEFTETKEREHRAE